MPLMASTMNASRRAKEVKELATGRLSKGHQMLRFSIILQALSRGLSDVIVIV